MENREPPTEDIMKYRAPVLRQKTRQVRKVNAQIKRVLELMLDTMYEANGVGLAGPQIGLDKALVVVDVGDGPVMLVNPEITSAEGSASMYEGCLSLPGINGEVDRAEKVKVKGLDENGRDVWIEAEGFFARALQHEIDHLSGRLFIDRAKTLVIAREDEAI